MKGKGQCDRVEKKKKNKHNAHGELISLNSGGNSETKDVKDGKKRARSRDREVTVSPDTVMSRGHVIMYITFHFKVTQERKKKTTNIPIVGGPVIDKH